MKKFLKTICMGIYIMGMSVLSIACFIFCAMSFDSFLNFKGFEAVSLFMALVLMSVFGLALLYILGKNEIERRQFM